MGASNLDYDLTKTLNWCAENGLVFTVTNQTGKLAITAERANIFAEYLIDEPVGPESIGNAMWAALFSVKHGTEYHARYGHFPPVGKQDPERAAGGGGNPDAGSTVAASPTPPLHPGTVPRRG